MLVLSLLLKYPPSLRKSTLFRSANKWDLLHVASPAYSLCKQVFDTNPSTPVLERFLNDIDPNIPVALTGSCFSPPVSPQPTNVPSRDFVCRFPAEVWRLIAFHLPTPSLIACCCTSFTFMCTLLEAGKYHQVWIEHFEPVLYFVPKVLHKLNSNFHTLLLQGGFSLPSSDVLEV